MVLLTGSFLVLLFLVIIVPLTPVHTMRIDLIVDGDDLTTTTSSNEIAQEQGSPLTQTIAIPPIRRLSLNVGYKNNFPLPRRLEVMYSTSYQKAYLVPLTQQFVRGKSELPLLFEFYFPEKKYNATLYIYGYLPKWWEKMEQSELPYDMPIRLS